MVAWPSKLQKSRCCAAAARHAIPSNGRDAAFVHAGAGAGTLQRCVISPLALVLSSCTPKPHSRATCFITSWPLSCSGRSLCWKWRSVSAAVATQVDVPDLDVGLARAQVVLVAQRLAHAPVAAVVVDGADLELALLLVVGDGEEAELAHQLRAQVLADEALVLEVAHRVVERGQPGLAGDVGEPGAVFVGQGASQMRLMSVYIAKPRA